MADRIEVRVGDAARWLPELDAELCFVDPPWEGYDPLQCRLTDLEVLQYLLPHTQRFDQVWLKLPPSFVTSDLPSFVPRAWFGHAKGDRLRVKFVWMTRPGLPASPRKAP